MLRMDRVHVIRHKVLVEGRSRRATARETGVSRKTVDKYLVESEPKRKEKAPRAAPKRAETAQAIAEILRDWEGRTTRKQRVTAPRIRRELLERGVTAGLTTIKEILAEGRRATKEVYVPLIYPDGDLAEVDFFEVEIEVSGKRETAWKFVMRLMASGADFACIYERCEQVAFLDGHVRAFAYFGGVPQRIAYDNLSAAVKKIVAGHRSLTDRFAALVSHYGFEACFARVGEGHDKGGVEARGRGIRLQHLVPVPRGEALAEINDALMADLGGAQKQSIKGEPSVIERLERERPSMRALPVVAFDPRHKIAAGVGPRSLVRADRADYSVPEEWARSRARVMAYVSPTTVTIVRSGEAVEHPRAKPGGRSVDYRHYLGELSRKPQALRQVAEELMKQLGEPFPRLHGSLRAVHGALEAARMMCEVLREIRGRGLPAVARAVERALDSDRLDLASLGIRKHLPVSGAAVPEQLASFAIEGSSALAYDALLGDGWLH